MGGTICGDSWHFTFYITHGVCARGRMSDLWQFVENMRATR